MPYDQELVDRIRELVAGEEAITEQRMFGGLAFLLHGHVSVGASHTGGLLVRVAPADAERTLTRPHASPMEMGGRTMAGWVRVAPEGVRTRRQLTGWVARGVAFAKTLPPK